ncbi:MAG: M48 family metalloprotease [Candidatus Micrarchaeia archaeon]
MSVAVCGQCITQFFANDFKIGLSILSLLIAAFLLWKLKDSKHSFKTKAFFVYGHLAFLFFPFALFTYTMACQNAVITCGGMGILGKLLTPILAALVASFVLGLVIIPALYLKSKKTTSAKDRRLNKLVCKSAEELKISSPPKTFNIDSPKPFAFSFTSFFPAIFLSIGLQELLSRRDLEAVVLHEMAHIKNNTATLKLSTLIARAFSPFLALRSFNKELSKEEQKADQYAVKTQGTSKFINSAKKKIHAYDSCRNNL